MLLSLIFSRRQSFQSKRRCIGQPGICDEFEVAGCTEADDVLEKLGVNDPVLDIAKKLEEVALNDPYFIERGLYPNVDFYSGIIYRALNIPTDMFTVMFALGRLPGWIAQWKEMHENGEPIGRPRQVYTGATERSYAPIKSRD